MKQEFGIRVWDHSLLQMARACLKLGFPNSLYPARQWSWKRPQLGRRLSLIVTWWPQTESDHNFSVRWSRTEYWNLAGEIHVFEKIWCEKILKIKDSHVIYSRALPFSILASKLPLINKPDFCFSLSLFLNFSSQACHQNTNGGEKGFFYFYVTTNI